MPGVGCDPTGGPFDTHHDRQGSPASPRTDCEDELPDPADI